MPSLKLLQCFKFLLFSLLTHNSLIITYLNTCLIINGNICMCECVYMSLSFNQGKDFKKNKTLMLNYI